MTAHMKEFPRPGTELRTVEFECNVCHGIEKHVVGVAYPDYFGGTFRSVYRPPDGDVEGCEHERADLCQRCALDVGNFIEELAEKRGGIGTVAGTGQYPPKDETIEWMQT